MVAAAVLEMSSSRDLRYAVTAANELKLSGGSSAGPAGHGAGPVYTSASWHIAVAGVDC